VAGWILVLVPTGIVLVGAWHARWVTEDAFIDFRIVANLLAGHGPVFNVGERVEAYSDPLWIGALAVLRAAFPFVSIEWWSVLLGLACTAVGFVCGGRAAQRIGYRDGAAVVLPTGLLMVSVVDAVWDFATSGLEMAMVFAWLGTTWWLVVRMFERRDGNALPSFVAGLGPLVRPELALMSVVFLAAIAVVTASSEWRGPRRIAKRWIYPVCCAAGLPVAYELWRMAYFALLVPNTGLAKSGGSSWWSQGLVYVRDFLSSDALWVPLLLSLLVALPRIGACWRRGEGVRTAVLAAPVAAGLVDALYVARVGGDYMHARLLLPSFFSIGMAVWSAPKRGTFRRPLLLPAAGIVIWSTVCVAVLRYTAYTTVQPSGIANERAFWVAQAGRPNPVDLSDYAGSPLFRIGLRARVASYASGDKQELGLGIAPVGALRLLPASSPLPFHLAIPLYNAGIAADEAGSRVYVFDSLSLANPIGAHTALVARSRPGHEKLIGGVWEVARFGSPGLRSAPGISALALADARKALRCAPLSSYLRAITRPLTFTGALSNMLHAYTYTTMSYSVDPLVAVSQLCR
jgi:arabinofuranosyltransferase